MKISDLLVISLKNIARGKLRTFLTVLAISIGIASVILLTVIGQSGKKLINDKLEQLGLNGIMVFSGDFEGLTLADGERIEKRVSEVSLTMPFDTFIGYYKVHGSGSKTAVIFGVDENISSFMNMEILSGRLFNKFECESGEKVCVVEESFAMSEFQRTNIVGKTVFLSDGSSGDNYTIVGVVKSSVSDITGLIGVKIPQFIYVPYESLGYGEDASIGQLAIKVKNEKDAAEVKSKVISVLKKSNIRGKYFQVENISEYRGQLDGILDVVTLVLSFTAAISLMVAGIGIMNSMLATVNDRRAEIGICKAIGATRGQIALIFLCEAVILSVIGGLTGAGVGLAVVLTSKGITGITPELSFSGVLLPGAVTIMTGLLSGLLPAVKASRMLPVAAIRKE